MGFNFENWDSTLIEYFYIKETGQETIFGINSFCKIVDQNWLVCTKIEHTQMLEVFKKCPSPIKLRMLTDFEGTAYIGT